MNRKAKTSFIIACLVLNILGPMFLTGCKFGQGSLEKVVDNRQSWRPVFASSPVETGVAVVFLAEANGARNAFALLDRDFEDKRKVGLGLVDISSSLESIADAIIEKIVPQPKKPIILGDRWTSSFLFEMLPHSSEFSETAFILTKQARASTEKWAVLEDVSSLSKSLLKGDTRYVAIFTTVAERHVTMTVIDKKNKVVEHYDSLAKYKFSSVEQYDTILKVLQSIGGGFEINEVLRSPHQYIVNPLRNGMALDLSCGIYSCDYAMRRMQGKTPSQIAEEPVADIQKLRQDYRRIIVERNYTAVNPYSEIGQSDASLKGQRWVPGQRVDNAVTEKWVSVGSEDLDWGQIYRSRYQLTSSDHWQDHLQGLRDHPLAKKRIAIELESIGTGTAHATGSPKHLMGSSVLLGAALATTAVALSPVGL